MVKRLTCDIFPLKRGFPHSCTDIDKGCEATVMNARNKNEYDGFVKIEVSSHNLDRWLVRTTILQALRRAGPLLHGALIDIGCGKMPYKAEIIQNTKVSSYTGLDIETALIYDPEIKPDVTWDGCTLPFPDDSFDCAIATEVFEHVPDIAQFLREIVRVLRPGGVLFFTTPFIWPYHEIPHDYQRWTALGLQSHLRRAGFRDENIISEGNWHSSLAQMIGLWAARAPMPPLMRTVIRYPVFILQKILMKFDSNSQPDENAMPRSISGTVRL